MMRERRKQGRRMCVCVCGGGGLHCEDQMLSGARHVPAGIVLDPAVCVCMGQFGRGARPGNNRSHSQFPKEVCFFFFFFQEPASAAVRLQKSQTRNEFTHTVFAIILKRFVD